MRIAKIVLVLSFAGILIGCGSSDSHSESRWPWSPPNTFERPVISDIQPDAVRHIVESAHEQLKITTKYSQEYFHLSYPNGDPPAETGACTDVVIRAFRKAGVDLQKEVHEDMAANFASYPQKWGLAATDTNIDHRRVPNLQTFFIHKGKSLLISSDPETYKPGDVVTWDLDGKGMTHIGLVSNKWNDDKKRYLIIHNIGSGVAEEDHLFTWKITGHYRYF